MIASARNPIRKACSRRWNDKFLQLLPAIREQAEYAFRRVPFDAREELVQEAIATAYDLFVSLCRRGKTSLAYATPLTKFADPPRSRRPTHRLPLQFAGYHVTSHFRGQENHDRAARSVQPALWRMA